MVSWFSRTPRFPDQIELASECIGSLRAACAAAGASDDDLRGDPYLFGFANGLLAYLLSPHAGQSLGAADKGEVMMAAWVRNGTDGKWASEWFGTLVESRDAEAMRGCDDASTVMMLSMNLLDPKHYDEDVRNAIADMDEAWQSLDSLFGRPTRTLFEAAAATLMATYVLRHTARYY